MWEGALRVHGHHKNHVICTGAGWRWQVVPASLRILRSGLICGQVGKTSSRQKTDQIECFQGELTTFRLQNEAAKNSGFLCYMRSVPVAWRHKRNVYNGRVGRQRAMVSKERALLPLAAKISCSSRPCAHPHASASKRCFRKESVKGPSTMDGIGRGPPRPRCIRVFVDGCGFKS